MNGVPFPQKIIQTPRAIVILYETRTTFRQIFLDAQPHARQRPAADVDGAIEGTLGGDTLIVETTGFNDKTWLDDAGHPHRSR